MSSVNNQDIISHFIFYTVSLSLNSDDEDVSTFSSISTSVSTFICTSTIVSILSKDLNIKKVSTKKSTLDLITQLAVFYNFLINDNTFKFCCRLFLVKKN